jgi:MFS transporter, PPP family, 3-phenylpropionic acid transporter
VLFRSVMMTALAIISLLLPRIAIHQHSAATSRAGIATLMRRPDWLVFFASVFLVWIATNSSIMFLSVTLSSMGANQGLIGLAITIGAVVEIPVMMFSSNLLRRFGPARLLLVAMVLMIVRYTLLGGMQRPEWAIWINLINGFAFPFFWNASVTYANKLAPPGLSGTVQGLLNSNASLAGMVSSLLTGYLFDHLGATRLFYVMAVSCALALILYGSGTLKELRRAKENA